MDLELATTEQILEELARRPIQFVFVSMFPRGQDCFSGYLAHSPNLDSDEALLLLQRAERLFDDELEDESSVDGDGPLNDGPLNDGPLNNGPWFDGPRIDGSAIDDDLP